MNPLDIRRQTLSDRGRPTAPNATSLGTVALERTQQDPDRVLVIDGATRLTRGTMLDMALRLGAALRSRGLKSGDAIAFQLPNWWEACVVNLACSLFGFRIVPLLTIYRTAELGAIFTACGVRAVFVPCVFRGVDFPDLVARSTDAPDLVFTVRGDAGVADSFEQLLECEPAQPRLPAIDDLKLVMFTSGSTGRAKGVIHSHATVDQIIRRTGAFWQTGEDDVFLVASPIGHIGGSIYAFEFPWITGCVAMLSDSWDPKAAVDTIDRHGVTFMAGATPFLAGLIAAADEAGTALPSLRRFICGGASVPPELVRKGLARFPHAVVSRAYGSTEVPLVCPGIRTREEAQQRADTDGAVDCEVRILAGNGTEAAPGEAGEIVVRAPQMLVGYLDPADDADAFTPEGFFRMGDLGRLVDGRFLEITGRQKDIIIRKGENISPLEIENALMRHQGIKQASVVGVPDPERGEMVVAFVIPVAGQVFGFADMTSHLDALGLARQKFPERLHVVAELPLNTVGKVQKNELRALALSGGTA